MHAGDAFIGHAPNSEPRRYAKVEIRPGAFHMVELAPKSLGSPGPPPGSRGVAAGGQVGGRTRPNSAPAVRGRLPVAAAGAAGTLPYQINTIELAPVRGLL